MTAGAAALLCLGLSAQAIGELRTAKVGLDRGTRMQGPAVASHRRPTQAAPVGNHGGTLVVDDHGVLVVERSEGRLIRASKAGEPVASLSFDGALGELVHDGRGQVFLADRGGDRVVRIAAGDRAGEGLAEAGAVSVREPHGLALTPDGGTLLVTSVAEHELVALDTATLEPRWRLELAPEPRGVAVSSDGEHAAVGFLTSSSLAIVELARAGSERPGIVWQALDPRDHVKTMKVHDDWGEMITVARIGEPRSRFQVPHETGRRYARSSFALAYIGGDTLVAAHQLATPQMRRVPDRVRRDTYGGGGGTEESIEPMVHRLGLVQRAGALDSAISFVELDLHQPRSLAYDLQHDVLYVGGYGDDRVVALAHATQQAPYVDWFADLGDDCGIDGLAVDEDGVWIHCELRRQLLHLGGGAGLGADNPEALPDEWVQGPELTPSTRDELVQRGADLFRRSNPQTSDSGTLACSNCHPEGRADGLTWRLGQSILQVPILAGRVGGTGPYKWDGQDPTLLDSLHHTMERLGGNPRALPKRDFDALVAYLEQLPAPKTKTAKDPAAAARGRAIFEQEACDGCHAGPQLTDRSQHDLDTTLEQVDTPSLLGLGHSSPYYHDGSAQTLEVLLTDRASVHEMADLSKLSDDQVLDLAAYLGSL
ncbi:hypothetical protein [Enhygromyxa salina]|uniref:hypothetical protein n=1 Tax=Enhygromyxa salina TaxID=215803 RepID=UPI0015E59C3B|nr:hypothetical protein [Enhygromyxa salina]